VCNLGSVNVGMFARSDVPADAPVEEKIDWEQFRSVVHLSTHFLDNVIDANNYPLPEIDALAKKIRRIGLGIMGWADLLIRVGVPYDSEEGIALARKVMGFIDEEAKVASEKLAETRGTFPAWADSIWGPDDRGARVVSGCGRSDGCATATSPRWRPRVPSPSSPTARAGSSRCSRWRSCGTRRAC
jgi:ribonucleoside-diphosphate reductase alpha chain